MFIYKVFSMTFENFQYEFNIKKKSEPFKESSILKKILFYWIENPHRKPNHVEIGSWGSNYPSLTDFCQKFRDLIRILNIFYYFNWEKGQHLFKWTNIKFCGWVDLGALEGVIRFEELSVLTAHWLKSVQSTLFSPTYINQLDVITTRRKWDSSELLKFTFQPSDSK